MKDTDLEVMFARVRTWSDERKEQAFGLLLALEKFGEVPFPLTDEELAELDLAIAEADRGEFATQEEIDRVFRRNG